jgi:ferredoxin-NADP reductase
MPTPQKIECQIGKILNHGENVYSIELIPSHPVPVFKPGQFLQLAMDPYDPSGFWPESRAFSIASSPSSREKINIHYSVRGKFTARMGRELAVGKSVWIKMPYGEFIISESEDVALFAGGTGISAFIAFLGSLSVSFSHKVYLFYGARHAKLLPYSELIEKFASTCPQISPFYFVEEGRVDKEKLMQGRLSIAEAWSRIRQPFATTYYLSGPPAMLQALRVDLDKCGIAPGMIKIDAWE